MPRWPDRTPEERFWSNVDKSGECWVWTAGKDEHGYGNIKIEGRRVATHRFSYATFVGAIPDGLCVCHRCDNPSCVRPDHLFVGTQKANCQDRQQKGRSGFQRYPELVKCGEAHHAAKLTEKRVRLMRALRAELGTPYAELAALFNVTTNTAHRACVGVWWKHVNDTEDLSGDLSGEEQPESTGTL